MTRARRPSAARRALIAVAVAAVCSTSTPWLDAAPASASGPDVWTGAGVDANWSTAANWVGGTVPVSGAALLFPAGVAQLTPHDDLGIEVRRLEFDAGGYVLSGAGITVTGSIATGGHLTSGWDFINQPLTLSGALSVKVGAGATLYLTAPAGTGHIVKSGTGTLSMVGQGGTASDSTPTAVDAGTLEVDSDTSLGSATNPGGIVIAAGATMLFSTCVGVEQTVTVAGRGPGGAGALSGCGIFFSPVILSGDATFDAAGYGSVWFTGSSLALGTHTLTIAGPKNFNGDVISGTGNLVHRSGLDVLTGDNAYSGVTIVKTGWLEIEGRQPASPVRVSGTAALLGDGTIGSLMAFGTATVQPGHLGTVGTLPGPTPNILNVQGSATLEPGTTLLTCISSGASGPPCDLGFPAGTAGELSASGHASVSGALLKISSQTDDPLGTVFTVASATLGISGTFANAPGGAVISADNGTRYSVAYHATTVTITRVP